MKKLSLVATVSIMLALLSALASHTPVMASPARIEEPSFETVTPTIWVYDETDGDYDGAQASDWASQPTKSYKLSCLNAGIGKAKYAEGNWHAVVIKRGTLLPDTYADALTDPDYVADDVFYVAASAIPEFPTVMAGIGVAGLCFGIYYWKRKRKLDSKG